MSKAVSTINPAANLPAHLQNVFASDGMDNLIASGGSFPIVSYKGKVFKVKSPGGEPQPLVNEDGEPLASIQVVIVDASKGMHKNWYAKQYQEGDDAAPDCFSMDGVTPSPQAENPQCESCAACPHNAWGSRVTDNGSKAKACSDRKILAVVPLNDLHNEALGGVMHLAIPPASLKDMSTFAREMKAKGYLPQQIGVRIGFDIEAAYPKFTFKAIRPLREDEVETVAELYQSEQCRAIIDGTPMTSAPAPVAKPAKPVEKLPPKTVDTDFEEEAPSAPEKAATKAATKPAAKPKAAPKPAEVVETPATETTSPIDADIDAILGDLDL